MSALDPNIRSKTLGGSLLVAGSCIGAAMLGLPVLTAPSGFLPSELVFFVAWMFMLSTGLLLLEVNLWFDEEVSLITMVEKTLGPFAKALAWITYLFLFYTLMVALVSGSGEVIGALISGATGLSLPRQVFEVILCLSFGLLIWKGRKEVDYLNRAMIGGLGLFYLLLLIFGSPHVDSELLSRQDWSTAWVALPVMILSFGFHNLVPSLTSYMKHQAKPLVLSLVWGSAGAFFVYLLWQWLILGIVPIEGEFGFLQAANHGDIATTALRNATGTSLVIHCAEIFGLLAMTTTFLGIALSVVDFLADGLGIRNEGLSKAGLCCLALLPPLVLSSINPKLFLIALRYAGSFGAMILFGLLPPLMVWNGRYRMGIQGKQLLPGGRPLLLLLIVSSLIVVGLELFIN